MISIPNRRNFCRAAMIAIACLYTVPIVAQRPPDIPLSPAINRQVVAGTIDAINRFYVSAQVAKELEAGLGTRMRRGDYDKISSAFDLIDALDANMQEISKDAHLKLAYGYQPSPMPVAGKEFLPETASEKEDARKAAQARNFGIERVDRLPGNLGYLEINSFVRPEFSGEATGMAMSLLAGSDALIIDLRNSSGGSADMVAFLASYFFDEEPYHLGDWYTRAENGIQQWWTYPYVPGKRYLGRDVYILVSRRSFSAVEGLASILQHHKRAVVIGEATPGGTHPGRMVRVHPNFAVFVPMSWFIYPTGDPTYPIGRPVFPTSKTDFQGTGVTPDISVPATTALVRAQVEALSKLIARDPERKERLQPLIDKLNSKSD